MATPSPGADDAAADATRTLAKLRGLWLLAMLQMPLLAFVVWFFPRNLLPSDDGGELLANLFLAVMGSMVLVLLVLATVLERLLRSDRQRFTGFLAPADPLRRYRTAKLVGFAMRDAAGGLGFVLGLMVADLYAYTACLLVLLALWLSRPRVEDLGASVATATASAARE